MGDVTQTPCGTKPPQLPAWPRRLASASLFGSAQPGSRNVGEGCLWEAVQGSGLLRWGGVAPISP